MANINYIEKHLKTFTVKQHKHNYWEIIYVTEGKGQIELIGGTSYPYSKGDVICIPPFVTHKNVSQSGFKNLHLTIDGLQLKAETPIILPHGDNTQDFITLLNMCYTYSHLLPAEHEINFSLANSIASFLLYLLKNDQVSPISRLVSNEIINNYTDSGFELDTVFNSLPYSKEYTRKLFLKEYKITPSKFLISKRIDLAKQLLAENKNNKYTIREIAESCGFSDQLYFSRVFKKETGVSPLNYKVTMLDNNKIFDE